jgi:hypothetical protein
MFSDGCGCTSELTGLERHAKLHAGKSPSLARQPLPHFKREVRTRDALF